MSHSNPPAKRRRRSGQRRAARRARGPRRNPPKRDFLSALKNAAMDGLAVTGGQVAENITVRSLPNILPATMPNAALANGLLKDVAAIFAGSFLFHSFLPADTARFVVAGQASAAINRVLRATNVPVISTALGEYDPMFRAGVGDYTRGIMRAPVRGALPPGRGGNNVSTLKNIGVYIDGMSTAPGLF